MGTGGEKRGNKSSTRGRRHTRHRRKKVRTGVRWRNKMKEVKCKRKEEGKLEELRGGEGD